MKVSHNTGNSARLILTPDLPHGSAILNQLSQPVGGCCSNSLVINPNKTKLIVFGTRQILEKVPSNFEALFLGKELLPVPTAKDLGVAIDSLNVSQALAKSTA